MLRTFVCRDAGQSAISIPLSVMRHEIRDLRQPDTIIVHQRLPLVTGCVSRHPRVHGRESG